MSQSYEQFTSDGMIGHIENCEVCQAMEDSGHFALCDECGHDWHPNGCEAEVILDDERRPEHLRNAGPCGCTEGGHLATKEQIEQEQAAHAKETIDSAWDAYQDALYERRRDGQ